MILPKEINIEKQFTIQTTDQEGLKPTLYKNKDQ